MPTTKRDAESPARHAPRSPEGHIILGWREWVAIPSLGIPAIKAKVDTGARTSALHAFYIEAFREQGRERVRFGMHPLQNREDIAVDCIADVLDQRLVSDSGGHTEMRYVIKAPIRLGGHEWPAEMTLTNRDTMKFRMLLGRSALWGRYLVDPQISYASGRLPRAAYRKHRA